MPSARYWRVVAADAASGYASFFEVAFLDADGVDLSTGGTASASSDQGSGSEAARAFDKSTGTYWSSWYGAFPAHIQYDHGAAVDVAAVRLVFLAAGTSPAGPGGLRVVYSSDGTAWSDPLRLVPVSGPYSPSYGVSIDFAFYTLADVVPIAPAGAPHLFAESATPTGVVVDRFSDATQPHRDFEFGGNGRIAGTVKRDDTPVDVPLRRRVRLHREADGMLIREVWSDPATGGYSFDYIDTAKRYTVIAYDYSHDYRAVIADNIAPDAIP